jgi:predicted ribosome quality control (RQC) complex YloA/Tae2 family protein
MAYDGIVVSAIVRELSEVLVGGRIDKIHQPEKDTVTIGIRTRGGAYRLLLCANPSYPRVHLMSENMENPMSPPMFCMLMRKHIGSGKITKIDQPEFERIIRIHIESYDEMGYLAEKLLICELMGKHSNIILTNAEGKIIDSVYHVDFSVSSVRQILPGLIYTPPPSQESKIRLRYQKMI